MSASSLPGEILTEILNCKVLYVEDVIRLRRVSRRWRDVIDCLPDSFWRRKCQNQNLLHVYATVREKYGFSWRSASEAVNSWERIRRLELPMNLRQLDIRTNIQGFKLLPNGIIAVRANLKHQDFEHEDHSDAVIRYSLETNKECGFEEYDFVFLDYDENDHFVVLRDYSTLCIITKLDKKSYFVKMEPYILGIVLSGNEVYSHASETVILSEMKEVNGKSVLNVKQIVNADNFGLQLIIAIAVQNSKLYIFCRGCKIYVFYNNRFETLFDIADVDDLRVTFDHLHNLGLDWRTPQIFNWVIGSAYLMHGDMFSAFYGHGHVFLCAYPHIPEIMVVFTDSIFNMEDLTRIDPKIKIDLKSKLTDEFDETIHQIDIVETETHHIVVVLAQDELFVVELPYCTKSKDLNRNSNRFKSFLKKIRLKYGY